MKDINTSLEHIFQSATLQEALEGMRLRREFIKARNPNVLKKKLVNKEDYANI